MYNGDAISIELDTYGDARNQIFLVANPMEVYLMPSVLMEEVILDLTTT